jgi:hypothetical protein
MASVTNSCAVSNVVLVALESLLTELGKCSNWGLCWSGQSRPGARGFTQSKYDQSFGTLIYPCRMKMDGYTQAKLAIFRVKAESGTSDP